LTVFRRRRETDDLTDQDDPEGLDDIFASDGVAEESVDDELTDLESHGDGVALAAPSAAGEQQYAFVVGGRPRGPWDSHDLPRGDDTPRVDLGGLLVPVPDGVEVRVEVQDEIPVAATMVDGANQMQVHAFAAPKSSGLWAEVRAEIRESLIGAGGSAEDAHGPFGVELRARIPRALSASMGRAGFSGVC
jgi:Protein of unknown function (DUF3710)